MPGTRVPSWLEILEQTLHRSSHCHTITVHFIWPDHRGVLLCSLAALSIAPLYARVNLRRDDADYTAVSDQMMIALRFGSDGKKVDVRVIPNEEWPQRTTRDVQSALVSENSLSIQAENTESTAGKEL